MLNIYRIPYKTFDFIQVRNYAEYMNIWRYTIYFISLYSPNGINKNTPRTISKLFGVVCVILMW